MPTSLQSPQARPPSAGYDAIVVGGSAGGIDALLYMLPALPATLRAAVLVVMHLPRDRPSLLAEIFRPAAPCPCARRTTRMPLLRARCTLRRRTTTCWWTPGRGSRCRWMRPCIFRAPPSTFCSSRQPTSMAPACWAFCCRAPMKTAHAACRPLPAAGGLVVVQDPASASMPTMPQAALARVAVHHVLPPAGIADLLAHLHENCLL
jgi:two-component system chemotaxis response regulator CheB